MMRIARRSFDAQPLHDGELSLVADLRLDNRDELAGALSIGAAALADMPDSALLLAAYKKWGADCVDHLIGDFAFAVWDAHKRTLTLARDHMGQRHVFYHQGEGFFAFATEIKGLWALPHVPRTLSESALLDRCCSTQRTIRRDRLRRHSRCARRHRADHRRRRRSTRRYWEPHADPAHEGRDEAYYIETYRKVLSEAVACRLRRTRPRACSWAAASIPAPSARWPARS